MSDKVAGSFLEYLSSGSALSLPTPKQDGEIIAEVQGILNAPERKGGVTFSLYFGDQWKQPFYAVGLDNDRTKTANPEETAQALAAFLQSQREMLLHPRCCLGVWRTTDADGVETVWLDIAILVYNRDRAQDFAQAGNQIALYDLRRDGAGEIVIGGTGESSLERLNRLDAEDRPE